MMFQSGERVRVSGIGVFVWEGNTVQSADLTPSPPSPLPRMRSE